MRLKKISEEVYIADEPIVQIGQSEIDLLRKAAPVSPRGRVRICAHRNGDDLLHEMMIALTRSTYIRPHKHLEKCESFHIIQGMVDVVAFDDDGHIREIIELGEPGSGRDFFYRLSEPVFHTLLIRSEILIVHETTNGPFKKGDAIFASWAPAEDQSKEQAAYLSALAGRVAKWPRQS